MYKLPDKKAQTIHQAVKKLQEVYPFTLLRRIISEFSQLSGLPNRSIMPMPILPKGQSFNPLSTEELSRYVKAINNRPRRIHHYQSANLLFEIVQIA